MSISGLGDEREEGTLFPDLPPKPDAPPAYADVIRQALRRAADDAYPDDLAAPYQEALRALAAGEIAVTAAPPVVTSEIAYTGPGGEPLTVADEAAEALKAAGYVIVSREDLALAAGFALHTGGKPRGVSEAVNRLLDALGEAK
jgi:hypothetical protein